MLILAAVAHSDTQAEADFLVKRIPELRIFKDDAGKMNLDLRQIGGSVLFVPNFTLYGDCSRGRRPAFDLTAHPEAAMPLFHYMVNSLVRTGTPTQAGVFGADMKVELVNDGPVTLVLDSEPR